MIRGLTRSDILRLARDFQYRKPDPIVERRSDFLPYPAFEKITVWKTERPKARYGMNRGYVEELTEFAFRQSDERRKIILLCTLDGVRAPVASALLHFGHDASYPILDRRALWSLRGLPAHECTPEIWPEYVRECRSEAAEYGISVRDFDKALWQYSVENQHNATGA